MVYDNDKGLYNISRDVYNDDYKKVNKFTKHNRNAFVVGTTAHTNFESHGLQASLIKVDGKYVVASRGTAGQLTDFEQDGGLANPDAYKTQSQFTDLKKFVGKMQKEHADFNPTNAVFTGHSLGGALATYGAVTYNAKATTFAAPNPYYELTPKLRKHAVSGYFDKRLKNYKHIDDIVSDVPQAVPNFSKQLFLHHGKSPANLNKFLKYFTYNNLGISGHLTDFFVSKNTFNKNGNALTMNSFRGNLQHDSFVKSRAIPYFVINQAKMLGLVGAAYVASKPMLKRAKGVGNKIFNASVGAADFAGKIGLFAGMGIVSGEKILVNTGVALSSTFVLEQASATLSKIRQKNNQIIPQMQTKFKKVKNEFANMFDIDVSDIIEETVNENRLRPTQVASREAISNVNHLVTKQQHSITELQAGIKKATSDQVKTDMEWSGKFHF